MVGRSLLQSCHKYGAVIDLYRKGKPMAPSLSFSSCRERERSVETREHAERYDIV
jgi:hypothetical protein